MDVESDIHCAEGLCAPDLATVPLPLLLPKAVSQGCGLDLL